MNYRYFGLALAPFLLLACPSDDASNNTNNANNANNQNNASDGGNDSANNTSNNANNLNNLNDVGSDLADQSTADIGSDAVTNGPLGEWCTGQPPEFSFFVTSFDALWILSESTPNDLRGGFGGDFGGIDGADAICQTIADATGAGDKTWRAYLSATDDGNGNPIHAIERIGQGPWVDANGRTVATGIDGLLAADRPDGDPQTANDLPDECGRPLSQLGDAHDVVTGSDRQGMLDDTDPESTCNDWTSSDGNVGSNAGGGLGRVMCGHSFPRRGNTGPGANWRSDHGLRGCGKGANFEQNGSGEGTCIGCTGGYGAIYCFAE